MRKTKKLFIATLFSLGGHVFADNLMVVSVPVANIRSQPIDHNNTYEFDSQQETQVEFGDPVLVLKVKDDWARVECLDQMEYSHAEKWQGYPGWIRLINLSSAIASTRVLSQPSQGDGPIRERIVHKAYTHEGNPYLWGGRSLHTAKIKNIATGVDCSGLINWAYKEIGFAIPRDAHEQYMMSRAINPMMMNSADLIFLAKETNPQKIVHVMLYTGEGMIIEAPQSGEVVRRMTIKDRLGKTLSQLKEGDRVNNGMVVYFGSMFGKK